MAVRTEIQIGNGSPLPPGGRVLENVQADPERVNDILNALKQRVTPKQARLVQKAIDLHESR